jgi:hypothetical protein
MHGQTTLKFTYSNSSGKYMSKFRKSAIQNKIQKLESDLLKPYLKKSPFLTHALNNVWFQAAVTLNKAHQFSNSGTTLKTKQPWIRISFRDDASMVKNLIKAQKNENMPITVTVATTLCFPLYTSRHNSDKDVSKLYSEKLMNWVNSWNSCYPPVQNSFHSRLLSKNFKIKIRNTIILSVALYGCNSWSLTLMEE